MTAFPRIYRSFADFERDELRKLDSLHTTVEDMLEERFAEDLELLQAQQAQPGKKRRSGRHWARQKD